MGKFIYIDQLTEDTKKWLTANQIIKDHVTLSESALEEGIRKFLSNNPKDFRNPQEWYKNIIALSSYSVTVARLIKQQIDLDPELVHEKYFDKVFTPSLLDYFYLGKTKNTNNEAATLWLKTLSSDKPLNELWPRFFTATVSSAQLVIDDKIDKNRETLEKDIDSLFKHAKHHPGILASLLREKPWWQFWGPDPISHQLTPKQLMELLFIYKNNDNYRTKICNLLLRETYFSSIPFMSPAFDDRAVLTIRKAAQNDTAELNAIVAANNAQLRATAAEKEKEETQTELRNKVTDERAAQEALKQREDILAAKEQALSVAQEQLTLDKAALVIDKEEFKATKESFIATTDTLEAAVFKKFADLKSKASELEKQENDLNSQSEAIARQGQEISAKAALFAQTEKQLTEKEAIFKRRDAMLKFNEADIAAREELALQREKDLDSFYVKYQKAEEAKPVGDGFDKPNFSVSSKDLFPPQTFDVDEDYNETNFSERSSHLGNNDDDEDEDDVLNNSFSLSSTTALRVNQWKLEQAAGNASFNDSSVSTDESFAAGISPVKPRSPGASATQV